MAKILQTIAGFGAHSGGTSTCTYDLLSAMHHIGCHVDLMTIQSNDIMGRGEEWIKVLQNDAVTPYGYSRNMNRYLVQSDYDLYHTNGMWMHCNHETCITARRKGKPYVITPHGMLYPEALARSAWKKWPLRKLWFNRDVSRASCIHVTCDDEMRHIRNFGYEGPVALIGNPVRVPSFSSALFAGHIKEEYHRNGVAFLGRLHPIKKIENLLYGVAKAKRKDIEVYILGKGDDAYEQFLNSEACRLGLERRMHFLGFISGKEKFKQLAEIDALFVPSDMENFGMIIPEALIVGTPVMASLGSPWQSLNTNNCGWWRDNSPESIAAVINEIYDIPVDQLHQMGVRGREYVINNFSADMIARQMLELYKWLLDEGEKPDFVYE